MRQDLTVRFGGLMAIAAGAGLFCYFLWRPLQLAETGAPHIDYSLKAFVAVPFCLVFGLAFLILGSRFEYRNATHDNLTLAGWQLFVVTVLFTALGFWWFSSTFAALGYS